MKKNLLFFGFALSFIGASAQSMSLVNPVVQVIGDATTLTGAGEMVAEWPVTNISNVSISLKCSRSVISEVAGTSNYFCWGVCFGETTNVSLIAQTILPSDTNHTFYAHYKPLGNPGQTLITYCFFNTANPTDQACQTVSFCYESICPLGVPEENFSKLELVGSNPLKGLSFINYQMPQGVTEGQLMITNTQGELVKKSVVKGNSGSILLNAQDYASGVYHFTLMTSKGMETLRLVVE
ncbi:MAG: T9SS type A sorting domain-containing protein [Sediminibacterium sp.]